MIQDILVLNLVQIKSKDYGRLSSEIEYFVRNLIGEIPSVETCTKDDMINEMCEIKSEMDKLHKINCEFECIKYYNDLDVIDRHIYKLRGEK